VKLMILVVALTAVAALFAVQPAVAQNVFTPDQVKFGPAPPFLPPGAQLAVLEGDPMASTGDFTIRLKMPDGYKVAPHTHPNRENVTVLSGTLKVGMETNSTPAKWRASERAASPISTPACITTASGETVIQIHGMSPVKFNYINPADDPSGKK
jgi:hypothetical protein